ncbi:MAG: aldehyde dehydrogenase family protein [Anaerolineae bacterium]
MTATKGSTRGKEAPTYENFIGGQWCPCASGDTYSITSPASKHTVLGHFQASSPADMDRAVQAAHEALPGWASTPAPQRAEVLFHAWSILRERGEQIARILTTEEGKALPDALGEVKRALNIIEYAAGEGRRLFGYTSPSEIPGTVAYTTRKPLGAVAIITPWNFPLAIPAWKIAPALICGNTLVFKPASSTPMTAIELAKLFADAGLPPGVLNLVTGLGRSVGDTLVRHPLVRGVSFTGSTETGTHIYTEGAKSLKKVQCEMGGKNAVILLDDADLGPAVEGIVNGAFGSTGQRCTATSRVVVEEASHDRFLEALIQRTKGLKIGNGLEPGIDVSPLASEAQFEKVLEYIGIGTEEGARLVYGGHALSGGIYDDGYYVEPTIFDDVKPDMRIAQEEIFGPVLSVFRARDVEEAIEIANSVRFGLSSSIYTRDVVKAFRYADQVETGIVHVNAPTLGGEVHLPFGGVKASGVGGREQGTAAFDFFTETVTVYIDYREEKAQAKFI